jgi:hypothetical protein
VAAPIAMPKNGTKNSSPDQPAPQGAADGAGAGRRRLMELDLAVLLTLDDDQVLEFDLVGLLELHHVCRDLLGGTEIVVTRSRSSYSCFLRFSALSEVYERAVRNSRVFGRKVAVAIMPCPRRRGAPRELENAADGRIR